MVLWEQFRILPLYTTKFLVNITKPIVEISKLNQNVDSGAGAVHSCMAFALHSADIGRTAVPPPGVPNDP